MKIAAFLATLLVRLLGVYVFFKSIAGLLTLLGTGFNSSMSGQIAIVLVLQMGTSLVMILLAGRIVRLLTIDAPFADE